MVHLEVLEHQEVVVLLVALELMMKQQHLAVVEVVEAEEELLEMKLRPKKLLFPAEEVEVEEEEELLELK